MRKVSATLCALAVLLAACVDGSSVAIDPLGGDEQALARSAAPPEDPIIIIATTAPPPPSSLPLSDEPTTTLPEGEVERFCFELRGLMDNPHLDRDLTQPQILQSMFRWNIAKLESITAPAEVAEGLGARIEFERRHLVHFEQTGEGAAWVGDSEFGGHSFSADIDSSDIETDLFQFYDYGLGNCG